MSRNTEFLLSGPENSGFPPARITLALLAAAGLLALVAGLIVHGNWDADRLWHGLIVVSVSALAIIAAVLALGVRVARIESAARPYPGTADRSLFQVLDGGSGLPGSASPSRSDNWTPWAEGMCDGGSFPAKRSGQRISTRN